MEGGRVSGLVSKFDNQYPGKPKRNAIAFSTKSGCIPPPKTPNDMPRDPPDAGPDAGLVESRGEAFDPEVYKGWLETFTATEQFDTRIARLESQFRQGTRSAWSTLKAMVMEGDSGESGLTAYKENLKAVADASAALVVASEQRARAFKDYPAGFEASFKDVSGGLTIKESLDKVTEAVSNAKVAFDKYMQTVEQIDTPFLVLGIVTKRTEGKARELMEKLNDYEADYLLRYRKAALTYAESTVSLCKAAFGVTSEVAVAA